MKAGWKNRGWLIWLLLLSPLTSALAHVWIEATLLNTGENLNNYNGTYKVRMMTHQMVAIRFTGHFLNESDQTGIVSLQNDWNEILPDYVEFWKEQSESIAPGETKTLTNVVYIRPFETDVDSFVVMAALREGMTPQSPLSNAGFKVIVTVQENTYPLPMVLSEPDFTPGTSNRVAWLPADGSTQQELYYFDEADRWNLEKAVRGLYKVQLGDTLQTWIEGLSDGHQYGYIVKTVHQGPDAPIIVYSDIVRSTQDNSPPEHVVHPHALVEEDSTISVAWLGITDALSGLDRYRIYRAVDTGSETILAEVSFPATDDNCTWIDATAEPGYAYHYRVTGVDAVGNEGSGDPSNPVSLGAGSIDPPSDDLPDDPIGPAIPNARPYTRGPVDTLWVELDSREEALRFQSVRDSAAYFINPPDLALRTFDSGWITPAALRARGWVHPQIADSIYYLFDYTDSNGESVDVNFVNGHTYIRRVVRQFYAIDDTLDLGEIVPDCLPPADVHNVKAEAVIDDPSTQNPAAGYTQWHLKLTWQPASDPVSGLKRYHIVRQIEDLDAAFILQPHMDDPLQTVFRDTLETPVGALVNNPLIRYQILAEDNVGNIRAVGETDWEIAIRSLASPNLAFADTGSPNIHVVSGDSIFTMNNAVILDITSFDTDDVLGYAVSVNGVDRRADNLIGHESVIVRLPDAEVSHIQVRALYEGYRSSLWSDPVTVIRAMDIPPQNLSVQNDPDYWKGHIYLQWQRPSLDAVSYQVWRWNEVGDSSLVGLVPATGDTLTWNDIYDRNELSPDEPDTLRAYELYTYRVRKVNMFEVATPYSQSESAYCNRPPLIASDDKVVWNNRNVIVIRWNRIFPTLASGSWRTRVRVAEDNPLNVVYDTADSVNVVDATEFSYIIGADLGHNYIFQVQETPDQPQNRPSSWSKPYVVNFLSLDSLFVQPQPEGHIFLSWDEDTRVDELPVETFRIVRVSEGDTARFTVPQTQTTFFDGAANLQHGRTYTYNVTGLDSLGQVQATNTREAVCDTGFVYIPEIQPFHMRYFNADSVTVTWRWRDIDQEILFNDTRGAVQLRIQVSLSRLFPNDVARTTTTEWFAAYPADPLHRNKQVFIPSNATQDNATLYCRITARDRWDHPELAIWSHIQEAVYDPIQPNAVTDLTVDSTEAYFAASDSILVNLNWSGLGVEPGDDSEWSKLVGNIAGYRMLRVMTDRTDTLTTVTRGSGVYAFVDTVQNRTLSWRVMAIDSAGNASVSESAMLPQFAATPASPEPTGFKACNITVSPTDTLEYFVEIAMNPAHFSLAYEMEETEVSDRLLCQSGWMTDNQFVCTTGWGEIKKDTTWFRVKARKEIQWESGWSAIAYFSQDGGITKDQNVAGIGVIPDQFHVTQNAPNPFNAQTAIAYQLHEDGQFDLRIYSITGSLVRVLADEQKSAGSYTAIWDGCDDAGRMTASGIYIARVTLRSREGQVFLHQLKMMMVK